MRRGQPKHRYFDASNYRLAIVAARFNDDITKAMVKEALAYLEKYQLAQKDVDVFWVPGAFELPITLSVLAKTGSYHCLVAIGCVIRGETSHFDYVAGQAASGIMQVMMNEIIPIGFGVLTTDTNKQAEKRIKSSTQGAISAALEVAKIRRSLEKVA